MCRSVLRSSSLRWRRTRRSSAPISGDCDLIFYAAASVTQEIWSALAKFAQEVRGEAPLMFSGWGLSETAPSATQTHQPVDRPGNIGVPLPEITLKLIPDEDGRFELRLQGTERSSRVTWSRPWRNRRRRSMTKASLSPRTP